MVKFREREQRMKTIQVSESTHEVLSALKIKENCKTYEDLILLLLDKSYKKKNRECG